MESHIYNLSKEQIQEGNDVTLIFNAGEKVTSNDIKISNFPLYRIKPQFIGVFIFYLLVLRVLYISKERFEIVHLHGDWSSAIFHSILKKITGARKVCLSIHDELSKSYIKQKLMVYFLRNISIVFCTGYSTFEFMQKNFYGTSVFQPSGIKPIFLEDRKRTFNNRFQILTVANLVPKKNISFLLEIAKKLPDYKFVLIGEGPCRKKINQLIINYALENFFLLGEKNSEEINDICYESDVFLNVSLKEGTPTAILEAVATGLPIVSSNAGGIDKVLGRKNLIFKDFSITGYVNALRELSHNIELRREISMTNLKFSKKFNWKTVANSISSDMSKY